MVCQCKRQEVSRAHIDQLRPDYTDDPPVNVATHVDDPDPVITNRVPPSTKDPRTDLQPTHSSDCEPSNNPHLIDFSNPDIPDPVIPADPNSDPPMNSETVWRYPSCVQTKPIRYRDYKLFKKRENNVIYSL